MTVKPSFIEGRQGGCNPSSGRHVCPHLRFCHCTATARHCRGFIFLSLEDETDVSNAMIHRDLYERNRVAITRCKFLRVEATLENQYGVINVRTSAMRVLDLSEVEMLPHDFH